MVFSEALLEETLLRLAGLMSSCRDRWCIFGGAALYLHGYRDIPFSDIDILASATDCDRICAAVNLRNEADGGSGRFRSKILLHPRPCPLEIEIMSDFEIFTDDAWQAIDIGEPVERRLGFATVPVASLDKVASIFRLSGREKDLARLKIIHQPRHTLSTP